MEGQDAHGAVDGSAARTKQAGTGLGSISAGAGGAGDAGVAPTGGVGALAALADSLRRLLLEFLVIAALVVLAVFARLHDLDTIPPGLHGDEAISGIEGRRILAEGWIGPYSPLALGQPTAPLYLTALSLRVFGDTVFAVRVVAALLGTLTVVALYAVLRRTVDGATGLAGAGLLAVMGWHLHFSRIGFPLAAWPLVVVVTVGAALEAARQRRAAWWAATGALAGFGIYVYNAQPLVIAVIAGFALYWLTRRTSDGIDRQRLVCLLSFAGALGLTLLPMMLFAADERNGYFQHYRAFALFNQPAWNAATMAERAGLLAGRYLDFWDQLCCHPVIDGGDATGTAAIVPLSFLALSAVGLALALWRRSGAWALLSGLIIVVAPLGAVLTIEGMARRSFAMAPFLAAFAGYGVVTLWRLIARRTGVARVAASVVLLLVTGVAVFQNLDNALRIFPRSAAAAWVFGHEVTDASEFMRCIRPKQHVYFLSNRWSVNYETRQFLAPDVSAEDRSAEFGTFDLQVDRARGMPVFVLLGTYQDDLSAIRERYPGGETVLGQRTGPGAEPVFTAYFLPRLTPSGARKALSDRLVAPCRSLAHHGG
jgi:4-amino-4-deoxy-L-arabinose transferase-like glycosyltransferase